MALLEILIVFLALLAATYTDIRVREVPDWLNFFLIAAGFGIAGIKAVTLLSMSPIYSSVTGFGLAFILSVLMFYSGQWGGGDAKMLMGIGALIGAGFNLSDFFISFVFNLIIAGAIYGVIWGIILGVIHRKRLGAELDRLLMMPKIAKLRKAVIILLSLLVLVVLALPLGEFKLPFLVLLFVFLTTFYLWLYIKAIEKVCMIKNVKPNVLTEGDWVVKDVRISGKYIAGKKDLGVSNEQIQKLITLEKKKKIDFVTMKVGIPFIPSFLMSFVLTYLFGNLFLYFI